MAHFGVTVPLRGVPLAQHREPLARLADAGFEELWSQEVRGFDALTPLAAVALQAPTARLGAAIAGVFTRGPALLAMEAAALSELAPGRFSLGIGSSSAPIVSGWNGLPFRHPYARVRDTLRFLRRALAGERIEEDYESFRVQGFALERAPERPPRLLVAALRERMLKLAGEEADGVCLGLATPEDVAQLVPRVRVGGAHKDVVLRVAVFALADAERARQRARRLVAPYLQVPTYARFHRWRGRGEVVDAVQAAWSARDRAAVQAAVPEELVDGLVVHGPPEACREGLQRFLEAGVTRLIVDLVAYQGDPLEVYRRLRP